MKSTGQRLHPSNVELERLALRVWMKHAQISFGERFWMITQSCCWIAGNGKWEAKSTCPMGSVAWSSSKSGGGVSIWLADAIAKVFNSRSNLRPKATAFKFKQCIKFKASSRRRIATLNLWILTALNYDVLIRYSSWFFCLASCRLGSGMGSKSSFQATTAAFLSQ